MNFFVLLALFFSMFSTLNQSHATDNKVNTNIPLHKKILQDLLYYNHLKGVDKCFYKYKKLLLNKSYFYAEAFPSIPNKDKINTIIDFSKNSFNPPNIEYSRNVFFKSSKDRIIAQEIDFAFRSKSNEEAYVFTYTFSKENKDDSGNLLIELNHYIEDLKVQSVLQNITIDNKSCFLILNSQQNITIITQPQMKQIEISESNYYPHDPNDSRDSHDSHDFSSQTYSIEDPKSVINHIDIKKIFYLLANLKDKENLSNYKILGETQVHDASFILKDFEGDKDLRAYNLNLMEKESSLDSWIWFIFNKLNLNNENINPMVINPDIKNIIRIAKPSPTEVWLKTIIKPIIDDTIEAKELTYDFNISNQSFSLEIDLTSRYSFPNYHQYFDEAQITKSATEDSPWNSYEIKISENTMNERKRFIQNFHSNLKSESPKPSDFQEELKDSPYLDYQHPILQDELKKIEGRIPPEYKNHPTTKIFYILDYIKNNISYCKKMNLNPTLNIPMKASQIIQSHQTVCGHYSLLFATFARAMGIPTRLIAGYSLNSDKDPKKIIDYHSWVEVNLDGKNWLPLEPQAFNRSVNQSKDLEDINTTKLIDAFVLNPYYSYFPVSIIDDQSPSFLILDPEKIHLKN